MQSKRYTLLALLAVLPLAASADIIVDTKNIDQTQYHADLYECQALSQQVDQQETDSLGRDLVSSTAKGAALGAAGSAIAGGNGGRGAQVGAGIGIISGALKHGAEERAVQAQHDSEVQTVMRNCMTGRGYTVLN